MQTQKTIFLLFFCIMFIFSCASSFPVKEYQGTTALRNKILNYELQNYDLENFSLADTNYVEAVILIEDNGDTTKATNLLVSASNSYQTLLDTFLPSLADELKAEIDLNRVYSKDIKAYKIDKESYETAELYYLNGISALSTNNYDDAVSNFLETKKYHSKAYFATKVKYDDSLKNIKEAENKLKEIEEIEQSYTNE